MGKECVKLCKEIDEYILNQLVNPKKPKKSKKKINPEFDPNKNKWKIMELTNKKGTNWNISLPSSNKFTWRKQKLIPEIPE
jgi:hypothetical protein